MLLHQGVVLLGRSSGSFFQLNLILWASAKLLSPSMHLAAALGHKLAFSKWASTPSSWDVAGQKCTLKLKPVPKEFHSDNVAVKL